MINIRPSPWGSTATMQINLAPRLASAEKSSHILLIERDRQRFPEARSTQT